MAKRDLLASMISGSVLNLSTPKEEGLMEIPLEDLHENAKNIFPMDDISELAESIQISGIQQPPVVTPAEGGGYRLVSGHRRRAAVAQLREEHPEDKRWKSIQCRVVTYASQELEELALITTNTQVRQNPYRWLGEASRRAEELLLKLQEEQGVTLPGRTRDKVAQLLKVSRAKLGRAQYIANHLEPELRDKWEELPEATATALAHMAPEQQREVAKRCRKKSAPTSAEVSAWAAAFQAGENPFDKVAREAKEKREAEKAMGPTVRCQVSGKKVPVWNCGSCGGDRCCRWCPKRYICEDTCQKAEAQSERADMARRAYAIRQALDYPTEEQNLTVVERADSSRLSVEELQQAVRLLGCSADYLLGLSDTPKPLGWTLVTEDPATHPEPGQLVTVVTWCADVELWISSTVRWSSALINLEDKQYWTAMPEVDDGQAKN